MRVAIVAALFALIPVVASAQSQGATLPPIGLPLPEIGLPLAPLGVAPPSRPTPVERAVRGGARRDGSGGSTSRRGRSGHGRSGGGVIYFVPVYSWPGVPGAATPGVLVDPPAETPATAPTRSPVPEPAPLAVPPATPAAPAAPPIPRKPFYFIEGCYLGDVPPAAAKLPASCDPAKATIFWP